LNEAVALSPAGESDGKALASSRKSRKKREAIIRAAITIINEKSYALATMTEIAASLDLRDATLYYYYPSKQSLAFACLCHSLDRFDRFLAEAEAADRSGAAKLESVIESFLVDSDRDGPLLYFGDYSYLASDQRDAIAERAGGLTQRLEQFLKDGIEDGSVAPCETALVVNLLLGMIIWLGKWTPSVEHLTVDKLMGAIRIFSFDGLART
jgi:AcrR family transcriptional regulator